MVPKDKLNSAISVKISEYLVVVLFQAPAFYCVAVPGFINIVVRITILPPLDLIHGPTAALENIHISITVDIRICATGLYVAVAIVN